MEYDSGEMGRGGATECSAQFVFRGQLGQSFVDFTIARARWLGLRGRSMTEGADVVAIVTGQEALVDSFEVTCSLGPIDATVDDWVRSETSDTGSTPAHTGNSREF